MLRKTDKVIKHNINLKCSLTVCNCLNGLNRLKDQTTGKNQEKHSWRMMSGQSFQGCGEQNNWGRERRREKRTGQDLLKTPLSSQSSFLERSGTLHCGKDEVEGYLHETLRPTERRAPGSMPKRGESGSTRGVNGLKEPSWNGLKEVVKKARSESAPGPNGIPYMVYKRCPMLLRKLW